MMGVFMVLMLVLVLFSDGDWQKNGLLRCVKFYVVVLEVVNKITMRGVMPRDFEFDGRMVAQLGVGFLELLDEVF